MLKKIVFLFYVAFIFKLLFCGDDVVSAQTASVRWVDDGDTIVLSDGQRVRYIGINAPELGHGGNESELLGPDAKNFNKRMVFQTVVRLQFDKEKYDHYGRLLAYIFASSNTFVNKEMLFSGYAYYLYRYPNIKYHDALLKAQQAAMKAQKGIWHNWQEKENRYVGNKKSRRFHQMDCSYAKRISPRNRIILLKMRDAFWQGYSPAKKCLPSVLTK